MSNGSKEGKKKKSSPSNNTANNNNAAPAETPSRPGVFTFPSSLATHTYHKFRIT